MTVDPSTTFRYLIEIGGIVQGAFTECSGLNVERKTEQVREGGLNDYVHTLPGNVERGSITLKCGVILSTELWDWFQKGLRDGKVERRDISIIVPEAGATTAGQWQNARTWWFGAAFPSRWSGPELKAGDSAVAVEALELAYGGEGGEGGEEEEGQPKKERESAVDLPALSVKVVELVKTDLWIECERQRFH